MVILSICPFIHHDLVPFNSIVFLVFRDKISCHWAKGVPTNEGVKEGHPSLKYVILLLLACLT